MPDVTVLMPVLNGGVHLRTAIDSILGQTFRNLELIVIDDGSTDGSASVAEGVDDRRMVVIRNERTNGLPAALNSGLRRAAGALVARLDQDDVARADRVERQVAAMAREPNLAMIGSQARLIDESGAVIGTVRRCLEDASIRWYSLFDNPFIHSSVMFRRDVVLAETGGYDESLRYCEDWALWSRVLERHAVRNDPDTLVDYRTSPLSMMGALESSSTHPNQALFQQIARALIARHANIVLGGAAMPLDDAGRATQFLLGVPVAELERFLALFVELLARFERRHPGCRASADFQRTLARQFDAVAYRLTPPGRWAALRVYAAAAACGGFVVRRLSWPRTAAMVLFGRGGRERLRRRRLAGTASR